MSTDGSDDGVRAAIEGELQLLRPQLRNDLEQMRALLHPDFFEFGASGRRWDRQQLPPLTQEPPEDAPAASGISGTRLAHDVVHVTYVSNARGRRCNRSSIWLKTPAGWRLYFHQGTPIPPG